MPTKDSEPWVRIKMRCACGAFFLMVAPKDWWSLAAGMAHLARGWSDSHAKCLGAPSKHLGGEG